MKTHSTFQIFSKSSCSGVLVSRALMNFISIATPQTEILRNCSENPESTDHGYVIQYSVHRDEIVGNQHSNTFRRKNFRKTFRDL